MTTDTAPRHATLDEWTAAGHKVGTFTRDRDGQVVILCRYCEHRATRVHYDHRPAGEGFWRYELAACAAGRT